MLDAETYIRPGWLANDHELFGITSVREGVDAILQAKNELKPNFEEIDSLRDLQTRVAEKVWLAGAPEEIATLLNEIGDA